MDSIKVGLMFTDGFDYGCGCAMYDFIVNLVDKKATRQYNHIGSVEYTDGSYLEVYEDGKGGYLGYFESLETI